MTLDEAIKHAEEVAEEKEIEGKLLCQSEGASTRCLTCAKEHRQLAELLKELKQLKEQQPVKPESTKGKWIDVYHRGWMCSNCNTDSQFATNFCSFCGADMRGEVQV